MSSISTLDVHIEEVAVLSASELVMKSNRSQSQYSARFSAPVAGELAGTGEKGRQLTFELYCEHGNVVILPEALCSFGDDFSGLDR